MLTITIENSKKMLIDVQTLVKEPTEHKKNYIKIIKGKIFSVLITVK